MRKLCILLPFFCLSVATAFADITGYYYSAPGTAPAFTSPVATRTDANINFNFGGGGPGIGGLGADGFAISWRGTINIPNEGTWTFYTAADDGTRLFIDGQLVINNWIDQGVVEVSGAKYLSAGLHDITVDYYENGGGAACSVSWAGPGVAKQVIPQASLGTVRTTELGILGRYAPMTADNGTFGNVVATRIDSNINFDFETGPGVGGLGADMFGGRWTGKIFIPQTGNWTLTSNTDDGGRVFIDTNDDGNYQLVVDRWVLQGAQDTSSGQIFLGAGLYNIVYEFYEWAGGEDARLKWTGPGVTANSIIPTANFFTHNRGFITELFQNQTVSGVPVVIRNDDDINYDWGTGAPQDRLAVDTFSLRWRGKIQPPSTGTWTFYTTSDDGVDLWVNGVRLINDLPNGHAPTEFQGSINLTAGVRYYIDLQYQEGGGGAACQLRWSGPGISKRLISKDYVYPIQNEMPTDIGLSNASVNDNQGANTTVGLLSTTDPDNTTGGSQSHSYALVAGTGSTHNSLFNISGVSLRINNQMTAGTYSVRVRTTDNGTIPDSLTFEKAFTITVLDRTAPVITLTAPNPQTVQCGSAFVEPGFTATDNVNGNITGSVVIGGQSVNTGVVGSYVRRYNVSDAAGNAATEATRTVNVIDNIKPVINVTGSTSVTVQCGTSYTDAGATVTEACSTGLTVNTTGLPIPINSPGIYTVNYNVTDGQGNIADQKSRTVTVQDTTAPSITLNGSNPQIVECGSAYIEAGASASDGCDPAVPVVISGTVNTGVPGSYTISYNATDDSLNNAATVQRTVTVQDTTPPTITLNGSNETIECGTAYVDAGASASDICAGSRPVNVAGLPINTSSPGVYTVTYTANDGNGNNATPVQRTVTVQDTIKPVITMNSGGDLSVLRFSTYTEPGATANDQCDGSVPVTVGGDTVNTSAPALTEFFVTYNSVDGEGQAADQVVRKVTIVSGNIPVITRNGSATVTVQCGAVYTDAGATATDTEDGPLTGAIITSNPVTTSTPGTYQVTYNVTDSQSNPANEVTRTVVVQDTTAPTLTLNGAATINLACNAAFTDPGFVATDACDTNIQSDVVVGGDIVDTSDPGTYVITYNVTDAEGNAGPTRTRTVNVTDSVKPTITRTGGNVTVNCGSGPYTDAGATASDGCEGAVSVTVSGLPIDTNDPGVYTVNYNAADSSGNAADTVTRTVTVQDITKPTLTLLGSSVVTITCGSVYTDAGATATDTCDGVLTGAITRAGLPIDTTDVGTHTITYNVSDTTGNAANAVTRTVNVQDATAPNITVNGASTIVLSIGDSFTDPGAFALDTCEGTLAVTVGGNTVNNNAVGTYIITYDATDSSGNDAVQRTRTVIVTAGEPPIITSNPTSQSVIFGDDPTFTVGAAALTQVSYQWRRNGTPLSNGAKYSGVTTETLTVNNAANADEGAYTCTVTASGSSVTSGAASLTVQDPGILTHPQSRVVAPGTTQQFNVVAAGSGTLTYQWRRNGINLGNAGAYSGVDTATLTVTNVQENVHEGDYTVVITGGADPAITSNVATLQVGNPAVTQHPESIVRNPGQSASFSVVVVGDPPLVYQWQKNGVNISNGGRFSGTDSPTLTITNVGDADEAEYRCRIIGQAIVTSNPGVLTVNNAPEIEAIEILPGNGVVSVGGATTMTVILSSGSGTLSYQWQRNGSNLNNNARISGANGPVLTITNAVKGDAGNYRCIVSNSVAPATSNPVALRVGLTITTNLFNELAEAGEPFSWSIDVDGGGGPVTYQWYKDDGSKALQPLVNGPDVQGVNSNTLTITSVDFDDAGFYQVEISDGIDLLTTNLSQLSVVEQLPALGGFGLAVLAGATALAGALGLRRRK